LKYLDEFRDSRLAEALISRIQGSNARKLNFMEVCGTHTVAILRSGIKERLRGKINLISGPGCPVCVSSNEDVDKAILIGHMDGVILVTFGDLLKVPGSFSSLEKEKADGSDIRVVYSSLDALEIARKNPHRRVVLVAIGFETTAPTVAFAVSSAQKLRLSNFFILSFHKLIPPVMKTLLDMGEVNLHGFICPGHVSAIIGSRPYQFIGRDYRIPCVIAGFEPTDILQAIFMLLCQQREYDGQVMIQYKRGVFEKGNPVALDLIHKVFEVCETHWRGIGTIPRSGLRLRDEYREFDAEYFFDIPQGEDHEHPGCICGQILRGIKEPIDCELFDKVCHPHHPIGPCMVSMEGSCAAYYYYGGRENR
jgi:hydrogenase expression/formation protein HypD